MKNINQIDLLIIISISITVRYLIGLWGYSGYNIPPMYGDFEAQRHWMEITISIPLGDWYKNTKDNNLLYWGLDYPPLTAYVSYLFGKLAEVVHPALVKLNTSHGYESTIGKIFMRISVIMVDLIVFIPSIIIACYKSYSLQFGKNSNNNDKNQQIYYIILVLSCLLSPSILLIDHGHFQYNGACLGFAIIGIFAIMEDHDIIGSILFCLSLNFKQIALYYSPVFFFVLLRKCIDKSKNNKNIFSGFVHLVKIGTSVIISFSLLWSPFCLYHTDNETCVSSLLHVLNRLFPFSRGIFEDKVANIWYTSSVLFNIKSKFTSEVLVRFSFSLTLLLLSPIAYNLLNYSISWRRSILALFNSSLAFFLASFQVHEKSLLFALIPISLLIESDPFVVCWFQLLGLFTMHPLLIKDGLRIPYLVVIIIYIIIIYLFNKFQLEMINNDERDDQNNKLSSIPMPFKKFFIILSYLGMIILHFLEIFYKPPSRYPDLFPALFSIFGSINFCFVYFITAYWQLQVGNDSNKNNFNSDKKKD